MALIVAAVPDHAVLTRAARLVQQNSGQPSARIEDLHGRVRPCLQIEGDSRRATEGIRTALERAAGLAGVAASSCVAREMQLRSS